MKQALNEIVHIGAIAMLMPKAFLYWNSIMAR
jgi:hypothetical protein